MNGIYSLQIDRNAQTPLYQQLGEGLCSLIVSGALPPNTKLPPIRKMAEELKVNAVTVVNAYKFLEQKKVAYSQVGSGTYVANLQLSAEPRIPEHIRQEMHKQLEIKDAINFANTSMPEEFFPVEEFKAAFNEVLDNERGGAFSYQDSQGYLKLRELLCGYLSTKGISCKADQIQIISGAQQGIDIAAKAVTGYGDTVLVEKPTFYGATGAFLSRGCQVMEVELEEDGMCMEKLETYMKIYRPKLLYMMAHFQVPTGISYSLEKKRRLLYLAEKYDAFIIEDDNLYDFYYGRQEAVPLKALDYKNRVIYIKSFSKALMPGLRIGCIVLPRRIRDKVAAAKYTTDISTSGFIQKAFALYLEKNPYQQHIQKLRNYGRVKYYTAIAAARSYLKNVADFREEEGGISLWLCLKEGISAQELGDALLKEGVILSLGGQYYLQDKDDRHIRLCFGSLSDVDIDRGMRRIGLAAQRLIEK